MREPKPFFRKQTRSWYVQVGKEQINLGRDKEAAWEEYHEIMAKRRATEPTASDSVVTLINKHLAWLQTNRAAGTFKRAMQHLPSFGRHIGPKLSARKLKPYHVQEWLDKNYSGTSDGYRNTILGTVKRVFSWAKGMGYITVNPLADMPLPPAGMREFFLPAVQWQDVLNEATDQHFRDLLVVMLASGARPQEVCQMQARHFEPEQRRIFFPKSQAKGRKKPRAIYLPDDAFEIISKRVKRQGEGHIFLNRRGNPWNKDSLNCRFRRIKKVLKLPKLCATVLRHSYAHHRLISGDDPLIVSKLMGHSDLRMISTRYGHVDAADVFLAEKANRIQSPLSQRQRPSHSEQRESA